MGSDSYRFHSKTFLIEPTMPDTADAASFQPLAGVRVLSLALNLPGPAALMRCHQLGALCVKLEPPADDDGAGDPMGRYAPAAYSVLHEGVEQVRADLKTPEGQRVLQAELTRADVLITSFRPSALARLGLGWEALQVRHPRLSLVAIVGAPGMRAEEPGHDLTYLAESGLVPGLDLPPTLYADMAGSLMASEAVLQALLHRSTHGEGVRIEVALSQAARYLALPRDWGLTRPGGAVGGAHAGYRVYACADGRVAVSALEPHFAERLAAAAGLGVEAGQAMFRSSTHAAIAAFLRTQSRAQLDALARASDLPLHTLADPALSN
ncbi:MAG: L-carnitine dehydratase/bile acid-inducible protein [Variovorax sp.]|nr:L-carnitine dehydratase/bile acid-inducible protein [Variovorax sp.]